MKLKHETPASAELANVTRAIDRMTLELGRRSGAGIQALPRRTIRTIVVAYDDSEPSRNALAWARQVAASTGAKVWIHHVVYPLYMFEHWQEMSRAREEGEALFLRDLGSAKRLVKEAETSLAKAKVNVGSAVSTGFPTEEIPKFVEKQSADLLIVGSHSRSALARAMIGSVADSVKGNVPCDVLIAKSAPPVGRILVPTDGSGESKAAAATALDLCEAWRTPMTVLYVLEPIIAHYPELAEDALRRALPKAEQSKDERIAYEVRVGHVADQVVAHAKDNKCGLIVMGSRGLGGLKRLMLGSVSNRVVHRAESSVWITRSVNAKGES